MKRISDLEKKYVSQVLENGFQGSLNSVFNSKLEQEYAGKFNARYAIGAVNGTATLHTALSSLGVGPGDEVVVPPLTMSSPALAVLQCGAVPVFADVDAKTFTICPKSIAKNLNEKTKAIITVALYGLAPDYNEILELCGKNGVALIEDNAQCFLGKYKGRFVGEFGDFSSYSFQASKHMTSGEGGMLTTNRENLADKARKFTSLGYAGVTSLNRKIDKNDIQSPDYDRHVTLGYNYRMSELAAAVALAQLERLEELVDNRIACARIFDKVVSQAELFSPQLEPDGYKSTYWTYGVMLNSEEPETDWHKFRDLFQSLGGDGYYSAWKLTYKEPLFRKVVAKSAGVWQDYTGPLCPTAERLQPRILQFKTDYWDLRDAHRQAEILGEAIEKFKK